MKKSESTTNKTAEGQLEWLAGLHREILRARELREVIDVNDRGVLMWEDAFFDVFPYYTAGRRKNGEFPYEYSAEYGGAKFYCISQTARGGEKHAEG